jgi:hypothetical protein
MTITIEVLLQRWQAEGLSTGTLKNRLAHLRWWEEKVGKAGILPRDNTRLGIPERHTVTQENKAKDLGSELDGITDAYVRMSLKLQAAFGLRREESIKFRPGVADRGDHIALHGSWTKAGAIGRYRSRRGSSAPYLMKLTLWPVPDR